MVTKANPNVVPLCDILLVLLIIFMIISPMVQAGVDVRLPNPGRDSGRPVVVSIEKNGTVTVNRESFSDLAVFQKWLEGYYGSRQDKTIFVHSDKDVIYKDVVKTLDIIKGAGVERVCLMPGEER